MEENSGTDPIFVHSPRTHYHSKASAVELSTSSSSNSNPGSGDESDVSDLVIDRKGKFENLSRQRRKSGGSDYVPLSGSNSMSESESESSRSISRSNESDSKPVSVASTPPVKRTVPSIQAVKKEEEGEEEEAEERRFPLSFPLGQNRFHNSPVVRRSPLKSSHRFSPSEVTTMRGYRYSMLPSRTAALNVSYSRYLAESDSDDTSLGRTWKRGKKRRNKDESESEFEMMEEESEEASPSPATSYSEELSEDDYRPPKKKGRKKVVSLFWN